MPQRAGHQHTTIRVARSTTLQRRYQRMGPCRYGAAGWSDCGEDPTPVAEKRHCGCRSGLAHSTGRVAIATVENPAVLIVFTTSVIRSLGTVASACTAIVASG